MRKFQIVFFLSLVLCLGFLREFLFIEINLRYYQVLYDPENTTRSEWVAFLDPLSGMQIYWFKWFLTFIMAGCFYLLGAKVLSLITVQPQWKLFGYVYLAIIGSSAILYALIWAMLSQEQAYTIARFLLGLAQSPFPLLFMIPALKLRVQEN